MQHLPAKELSLHRPYINRFLIGRDLNGVLIKTADNSAHPIYVSEPTMVEYLKRSGLNLGDSFRQVLSKVPDEKSGGFTYHIEYFSDDEWDLVQDNFLRVN
jgi:hypothetical protein